MDFKKLTSRIIFYFLIFFISSCNQKIEKERSSINTGDKSYSTRINKETTISPNKRTDFQLDVEAEVNESQMAYAPVKIPASLDSELSKINNLNEDPAREILSKRDRTAKHYLHKDGNTIEAVLSPKSLHYRKDGKWENINTNIIPSKEKKYAYSNQANNLKSWFPHTLGKNGVRIKTVKGELIMGQNLGMLWADKKADIIQSKAFASSDLNVTDNKIIYKNVLKEIHNEYIVGSDELKHNIILEKKPVIPENAENLIFSEDIILPENWRLVWDQNHQGLMILKENKEIYLEIPFPHIYETNNSEVKTDDQNSGFDFIQLSDNKYRIYTKIATLWLKERSFPIIIDPTLILNGSSSGYMRYKYTYQFIDRPSVCGYDYTNYNRDFYAYNNTQARVIAYPKSSNSQESYDCKYGWRGTKYYKTTYTTISNYYRGWIKYNTSTIPDTGEIQGVEFSGNISSGSTENFSVSIYSSALPGPYSNQDQSYWSITSAYLGNTDYSDPGQYPYVALSSNANTHLQDRLSDDYFQIGLDYSVNTNSQKIKYFDTSNSLLRITYTDGCQPPVAISKNFTAQLDSNGTVTIVPENIDNGSTSPCGLESITLSQNTFYCSDVGDNPVTLTITDLNGNQATADATVTVADAVAPDAIAQDMTIQLDTSGKGSTTAQLVDNGSNDACGIQSLALSKTDFDCSNIGANTVTLTVTDNNGNVSTVDANVQVKDEIVPAAIAQDVIVQLDASGNGSTTAQLVDNGSNDACGIQSLALSQVDFDCSNIGPNNVTLTVTDNNGNISTVDANVEVKDEVDPAAIAQDVIVQLDASGNGSTTAQLVDNGSNDACGIQSLALSQVDFDCSNIGPNNVTLTVTDNNGNISMVDANVEVKDEVDPVAIAQDVVVQLDEFGNGSTTAQLVDNGSNDACGIQSLTLSKINFDCSNIGANTVTLTVTDTNGNVSTVDANVQVKDEVDPVAIAQDVVVQLDEFGNGSTTAQLVDNGSNDACGIQSLALSKTEFDCSNIGANTVTLTVNDNNGNVSTVDANVQVKDEVDPVAIAQDVIVQLDAAGNGSTTAQLVDNGSNDACGIQSLALSQVDFDCSNIGPNNVTLTVTDNNGNISMVDANVEVKDEVDPVAIAQDVVVQLDEFGNGSTTAQLVDNGSNDACGIQSLTLSKINFDCSNIGANTVTLTVTDTNGNVSTVDANVEVKDEIVPAAIAQDVIVQLDASGNGSTTAQLVDNGSNDACGIQSLALSKTEFDCSNIGANTVTLTVTDNNGNVSTVDANVEVKDQVKPAAIAQDVIVELDASGNGSTTAQLVDNGSNDACGIQSLALSKTEFDCSNIGANTVTLTVTDNNGNISTVDANVEVKDEVDPVAIAQVVIVQLDEFGNGSTTAQLVDNGSNDACGIQSLALSKTEFDCSNIGANTVTLTVTDNNGNISTVDANVEVKDEVDPVAIAQDVIVQLDEFGNGSTTAQLVDNGSNDACGIQSLALSKTEFDCSNIGANTVTLTVTDNNGNVSTVDANVQVKDEIVPAAIAQDVIVQLDEFGNGSTTAQLVDNGSNDACGIQSLTLSKINFDCSNIGANTVTLTVTDNNGNISTVDANVEVKDEVDPVAIAQEITVQLDASGTASIVPADINNGSNDACGIASLALDVTSFDCTKIGPNTVTLTVTDNNKNVSTTTATVTVEDDIAPVAVTKDIIIDLDASGNASITTSEIDNGSYDNCNIVEYTLSKYNFSCADVGDNSVTLTVKDPSGNSDSASVMVTVNTFKPVTSISVTPGSQQYSDQVIFIAKIENGYCNSTQQAATEVKFYIGNELIETSNLSVSGNDLVGTLTTELLEGTAGSMSPGIKAVKAVFDNVNSQYELDSPASELTITPEDAIVEYTGQSLQATRGSNDSETVVLLTTSVQDIAISSASDNFEGDIRNARVKFVNKDSGMDISPWLPVNLINSSDLSTGSASFEWTVDIGNFDAESYTIGIVVDNSYYLRDSSEDNTVITVYKPVGDFITGGGNIYPSNSSGIYAATGGLKTNFGFNVKYNKKGNKLKGHMNVVFRRMEADGQIHTYQIKGNAIQSLGVNVNDQDNQTATFITKSNLTDITDPNNPVSLGGNLYLKVEMTDRGEPGINDSIAITLTESDGALLYSSEWNGLSTDEITLSNGNLVVKSGFSLEENSNLETADTSLNKMDEENISIDMIVSPNPTNDYFTASIVSKNKKDRVELFVYSYAGSLVYSAKGKANDKFTFGTRFETGTYIVKIFQAGQTAEKVVIKK